MRGCEPGARVVILDNRFVAGSSTPIARADATAIPTRCAALDDGSVHEVLKNFPTRDEALAVLGARAHAARGRTPALLDVSYNLI